MANWSDLKAAIAQVIKTNGTQAITGQILQDSLNNIISNVGKDCTFAGIATPTTNPGVPDGNVFYLATEAGIYANFNGIEIATGEAIILEWRGSWVKKTSGFATQQQFSELYSKLLLSSNKLFFNQGGFEVDGDINNETTGGLYDVRLKTETMRTQPVVVYIPIGFESNICYADETMTIVSKSNFSNVREIEIDTQYPYCRILVRRNDGNSDINPKDIEAYILPKNKQFDLRYLTEMNVSGLPFSNTQNEVLTKEEAIQRINQIFNENFLSKGVLGYKCRYYNGTFVNVVKYTGGGDFSNPDNWVVTDAQSPFPFKSIDSTDKLDRIRCAVKELYVTGEKVKDLKILLLRNSGYGSATNTDLIIGTGTSSSDIHFVERLNLGAVQQKGLQKHIQGRMTVIVDWDLVNFDYKELYSDVYILSDSIYNLRANPTLYADSIMSSNGGYITVNANGGADYTDLQDAIDNAGDSENEPKTILLFPGKYTMPAYDSSTRYKANNRYLSIVGTDKINCIIQNKVGYYITGDNYTDNACIKLAGNCYLANVTLVSTDEEYPGGAEADRHKAYCVHADFTAPENTIFEINNCRMVNNHFACIGFGLRKNYTLKIINTEMTTTMHENNGDGYGTLYGHDGPQDGQQNLVVVNCVIENTNTTKAIAVLNAYNKAMNLTFINNVCGHNGGTGFSYISDYQTINKMSYGNNIPEMNFVE